MFLLFCPLIGVKGGHIGYIWLTSDEIYILYLLLGFNCKQLSEEKTEREITLNNSFMNESEMNVKEVNNDSNLQTIIVNYFDNNEERHEIQIVLHSQPSVDIHDIHDSHDRHDSHRKTIVNSN